MLTISDASNLAFHSMMLLATLQKDQTLSVNELSEKLLVSANHLSKVMQRLAKAGLVKSRRGPTGGFSLAKKSDTIFLGDIYIAIEGPLPEPKCLLQKPICDGSCCLLGNLFSSMQKKINEHFTQISLKDVRDMLPCSILSKN